MNNKFLAGVLGIGMEFLAGCNSGQQVHKDESYVRIEKTIQGGQAETSEDIWKELEEKGKTAKATLDAKEKAEAILAQSELKKAEARKACIAEWEKNDRRAHSAILAKCEKKADPEDCKRVEFNRACGIQ